MTVLSFSVALSATLVACGGGGASAPGASPTPPPPPAATGSVTLTGIAARGAALAGAAVSIKCAGGNGSATTSTSGAFSVAITGASLPCAFQVTGTDGTVLHSLRAGSENTGSFNVNITPLTELVVARAAGATPSSFFTGYAAASAPSAATVTQAIDAVRSATAGVVDLTGINPITDTLVAAYAGTAGNALDQKIDSLGAALTAAQTTLAQVSSALVANPTATGPVATILQPTASTCAWLRSGKYRMIDPSESDPLWRAHVLTLNSATLTATLFTGEVINLTDQGGCKFTVDDASSLSTIVVSSAGVLVVQQQSKSNPADVSVVVGLPEQSLPLSDFAGTWNFANWYSISGSAQNDFVAEVLEVAIDATGQITSAQSCEGLSPCVTEPPPQPKLVVNATSGGFDMVEGTTTIGRFFLFKNGAGLPTLVGAFGGGDVLAGTLKRSLGTLPAVGTVSAFRELALRGSGAVDLLIDNTVTITTADAATKTVTRTRSSDNRVDTLSYDKPRDGLRHRAQNACTTNGAVTPCAQTVQIPLPGSGITLSLSAGSVNVPQSSFFNISVSRPGN